MNRKAVFGMALGLAILMLSNAAPLTPVTAYSIACMALKAVGFVLIFLSAKNLFAQ